MYVLKLFFDTEFTGLHKDTTLISIGIIAENGKKFYAEFGDYAIEQCDEWIQKNVIANMEFNMIETVVDEKGDKMTINGDKEFVADYLKQWLLQFDEIQFVSDVCHYDFVLLIDLFGSAWDLPENVNPACHDINQDIASYYEISEKDAFDKSREKIVDELCGQPIQGDKHNALYDAEVIKAIYDEICCTKS